jgi:hypothetical protein
MNFTIEPYDDSNNYYRIERTFNIANMERTYFISNQDDEGITLTNKQLFDLIDKYFRENL